MRLAILPLVLGLIPAFLAEAKKPGKNDRAFWPSAKNSGEKPSARGKLLIVPVVLSLFAAGCTLPGPEKNVALGEEFSLSQGESAVVKDYGNLRVKLVSNVEKCPTAGEGICTFIPTVEVSLPGSQPQTFTLSDKPTESGTAEAFGAMIKHTGAGPSAKFVVTVGAGGSGIDGIFGDSGDVAPPQLPE